MPISIYETTSLLGAFLEPLLAALAVLVGERDQRNLRDERDGPVPTLLSAVTFLASLALPARLACSPSRCPDDPLDTIVASTEVEVLVIMGQCFR